MQQIQKLIANSQISKLKPIAISREEVEVVINSHRDIIDPKWEARHAKLIYLKGCEVYESLAERARKKGKPPMRLMAFLVNQELRREA